VSTRRRVQPFAFREFGADVVRARLAVDIRDEDRPAEKPALDHDLDAVAVVVERRHRVRQLPDLPVLRVEDVRAVRLVEDALEMFGADQATRDLGLLQQDRGDAFPGELVGQRAAGQAGADDQYAGHRTSQG
jgi:hypothetical protein